MKKIYSLLFFIPFLFQSQIHAQGVGHGEIFGLVSCSSPKSAYHFTSVGIGALVLGDTMTFRWEKDLHSPQFQFGLGFSYSFIGTKNVNNVPLSPPRNDSGWVSITNQSGSVFADVRCITARNYSGNGLFPYLDFFTGYRFLGSRMEINPYHKLSGFETQTVTYPGKASGLLFGFGAGLHLQFRIKKTFFLFDSELFWNYCPVQGMLAKTSTLKSNPSGIYLDMVQAPNNTLMLKVGICIDTKRGSYDNSEADYARDHPAPKSNGVSSNGKSGTSGRHSGKSSGGSHNSVHVSGGHGGGAK